MKKVHQYHQNRLDYFCIWRFKWLKSCNKAQKIAKNEGALLTKLTNRRA